MLLLEPIKIHNLELKNRIVMPPMCMYSAKEDGILTPWHKTHYLTRAMGGTGLIIMEATGVTPEGRISDNDLGLWDDSQVEPLKDLVKEVHETETKIGIQLAHAGRKSESKVTPHLGPTDESYSDDYIAPKAMDEKDIETITKAFKEAARRCVEIGFDAIEIHAAHGYLIHEFLSPILYKKNFDERFAFLEGIVKAIKEVWPEDKLLIVRLSATDYRDDGISKEDFLETVKRLKELGVHLINVSTGGLVSVRPPVYPGYQVKFSRLVKENIDIATIAGGLIDNADMANRILGEGEADFIYMGRELLRNPYFVINQMEKEDYPVQYQRAYVR